MKPFNRSGRRLAESPKFIIMNYFQTQAVVSLLISFSNSLYTTTKPPEKLKTILNPVVLAMDLL